MNDIFEDNPDPDYKPTKFMATLGKVWDSFEKPPNQRRYIQKLDLFILSYSLLSYGLKSIDVSNVSNAYVSGMKQDVSPSMFWASYGQERNLFTTFFNIGYLVGSTPSLIIINRIRPSLWIPSCELVWSCLVMGIAAAKNAKTWAAEEFQDDEFRGPRRSCFRYVGYLLFSSQLPRRRTINLVHITTAVDVIEFIALLTFLLMSRYDRNKKGLVLNSFGLVVKREEYLANLEELKMNDNRARAESESEEQAIQVAEHTGASNKE
ncbi:hypothetical protein V1520DRAFT_325412 [Lipomyces starkeyi]